jgi:hypothetical protein
MPALFFGASRAKPPQPIPALAEVQVVDLGRFHGALVTE